MNGDPGLDPRAEERIASLRLVEHPEGGWYREIFRSDHRVVPADGRGERAGLSVILFLLATGERSRWHTLRSDEQWTHLDGDPLELWAADVESGHRDRHVLGPAERGGRPTVVVRAGVWQAARALGAYSLVTCTVGPGFAFEDFRFLSDDVAAAARLRGLWPDAGHFL